MASTVSFNPAEAFLRGAGMTSSIINQNKRMALLEKQDERAQTEFDNEQFDRKQRIAIARLSASWVGEDGEFDLERISESLRSSPEARQLLVDSGYPEHEIDSLIQSPGDPESVVVRLRKANAVPGGRTGVTTPGQPGVAQNQAGEYDMLATGDGPDDEVIQIKKKNLATHVLGMAAAYNPEVYKQMVDQLAADATEEEMAQLIEMRESADRVPVTPPVTELVPQGLAAAAGSAGGAVGVPVDGAAPPVAAVPVAAPVAVAPAAVAPVTTAPVEPRVVPSEAHLRGEAINRAIGDAIGPPIDQLTGVVKDRVSRFGNNVADAFGRTTDTVRGLLGAAPVARPVPPQTDVPYQGSPYVDPAAPPVDERTFGFWEPGTFSARNLAGLPEAREGKSLGERVVKQPQRFPDERPAASAGTPTPAEAAAADPKITPAQAKARAKPPEKRTVADAVAANIQNVDPGAMQRGGYSKDDARKAIRLAVRLHRKGALTAEQLEKEIHRANGTPAATEITGGFVIRRNADGEIMQIARLPLNAAQDASIAVQRMIADASILKAQSTAKDNSAKARRQRHMDTHAFASDAASAHFDKKKQLPMWNWVQRGVSSLIDDLGLESPYDPQLPQQVNTLVNIMRGEMKDGGFLFFDKSVDEIPDFTTAFYASQVMKEGDSLQDAMDNLNNVREQIRAGSALLESMDVSEANAMLSNVASRLARERPDKYKNPQEALAAVQAQFLSNPSAYLQN